MNRLFIVLTAAFLLSLGAFVNPVLASTVEEKNAACQYQVAAFGLSLAEALDQGASPDAVRKAIKAKDPEMQSLGEKLLDAILSRDAKAIDAVFNDMVGRCVTLLTKKEQVRV